MRGPQCSVRTRPRASFDRLAGREQRPRLERGLQQDHLVEVGRLVHPAERRGLFDRGRGDQPSAGQRGERGARRGEMLLAIAEIAAERDVRSFRQRPPASGLDREVPRDPLEVRRRPRRAGGSRAPARPAPRRRHRRAAPAPRSRSGCGPSRRPPVRSARSARSTAPSCSDAVAAMASRVTAGLAGGADDRVERLRRIGAQLLHARPPPPGPAPSVPRRPSTWRARSPPAAPAPRAPPGGSAPPGRAPPPPPRRSRAPPGPARAASIAALSAMRLVRSAISRIVPMKPLIRLVSAPSVATCSTLADDEALEPDQPLDRLGR